VKPIFNGDAVWYMTVIPHPSKMTKMIKALKEGY
jgi:hypothetical protein